MGRKCLICNEIGVVGSGISFHVFPKIPTIRMQWFKVLGWFPVNPKDRNICSKHFTDECFYLSPTGIRYLKKTAVPSIKLETKSTSLTTQYIFAQKINEPSTSQVSPSITKTVVPESVVSESCSSTPISQTGPLSPSRSIKQPPLFAFQSVSNIPDASDESDNTVDSSSTLTATEVGSEIEEENRRKGSNSLTVASDFSEDDSESVYNEVETVKTKKVLRRFIRPRYFGDCPSDVPSLNSRNARDNWAMARKTVISLRKKVSTLQQQNRRLRQRVASFKTLLAYFKHNRMITANAETTIILNPLNSSSDVDELNNFQQETEFELPSGQPENTFNAEERIEEFTTFDVPQANPVPVNFGKPYFKSIKAQFFGNFAELCRICFCTVVDGNMTLLYKESEQTTSVKMMLRHVFPALDLDLYTNSVICKECCELLASSYELKKKLSNTEELLMKIIQNQENVIKPDCEIIIATEDVPKNQRDSRIQRFSEAESQAYVKCNDEDSDGNATVAENLQSVDSPDDSDKSIQLEPSGMLCEICRLQYQSPQTYKAHLINKHSGKEKAKNLCEFCGVALNGPIRFAQHLETHDSRQRFQCDKCGVRHNTFGQLKLHIRCFHSNVKVNNPLQCHICGKNLARTYLLQHLSTHKDRLKTFSCNICNKKFPQERDLRRHMQVHNGDKQFKCQDCGKAFKYRSSLNTHIKRHECEADFVCNICKKMLSKKRNLISHKRKIHGFGPDVS